MVLMLQNVANRMLASEGAPEHVQIAKENARGDSLLCWGLTEPGQGSDAQAIQTAAKRDGDEWLIDGTKTAITAATSADYMVLYAQRSDSDRIGAFLVPLDTTGIKIHQDLSVGGRVSGWGEVHLDTVRIPDASLITDRDGFKLAMDQFDVARGWIPLFCFGSAQQTIEET
jgi:cyclohexanecarboxyl-CoA dehydrogenase